MNTGKAEDHSYVNCHTNIMLLFNQLALGTDVTGSTHQFNFSRGLDASQLVNIRPAEIRPFKTFPGL